MRWIVGLLLVTAALLKGLDLTLHPASVLVDNYSWFLLPVLVGGELSLGLAAIAPLFWNRLRVLAILLFASFAGYSLWLALHGAASCGCFGPLDIHPWWTFFLDSIVLAGLVAEYFWVGRDEKKTPTSPTSATTGLSLVSILLMPLGITAALTWQTAPRLASSHYGFQTVGDLVILEPETWIGQKFPLAKYINVDVSQGSWVLLLHRHDCPKCQDAVPKYEQLAISDPSFQVAIIEVPPYGSLPEAGYRECRVGKLSEDRYWFVQTPVEIELENGVVVNTTKDLPSSRIVAQQFSMK